MIRSLLVALDGSPFAEAVLPLAVAVARGSGAPITVALVHDATAYLHVGASEITVPPHDPALLDAIAHDQHRYLDTVVTRLLAAGVAATAVRREGTVVEALSDLAVELSASLLLLTTHGRGGLERLWIGSVATSLLQRSTVPLLLVRPTDAAATPRQSLESPASGWGAPILVPLDGSPTAESILPLAQSLAGALGNSLTLFRAVEPQGVRMAPFGAEALLADDLALGLDTQEATEYLERTVRRLTLPDDTPRVVSSDMSAARAIIDEVARSQPSIVALATHGRTGVSRLMLGSVADKLVRSLDRPLLVWRPPER
jgi:nucleotide-binding universal stress UspA family protein